MASELGSLDFSGYLSEVAAANWYAELYLPRFSDPDSFTFEDLHLPQNIFEQALPSPPPPSTLSAFPSETPLVVPPIHTMKLDAIPPLQTTPGVPSTQPRATTIPPTNVVRSCYKGATGTEPWIAGGQGSSAVVSAIPPRSLSPLSISPMDWVKIPQRSYNHGRKQWNFKPSEPISFSTNGVPGINLRDALRRKFADLDGRDDPMLQGAARAISCRLGFPGYPDNGQSCQIHTRNWTKSRLPITRSKLAHEVARKLEWYLNRMARVTPDESTEDRWRIDGSFMRIDNMFLVGLVPVSKGSFQPEIWITAPPAPYARAGRS